MALKKSQLYSSLWASCDELRGGMDASQYKDYILTLLFMKYVTDKAAADPTFLIDVPEGGSFADMVKLRGKTNIGEGINTIIARLAEANDLKGVIDQADFDDAGKLGSGKEMQDRLSKLIGIFENIDLRANRAEGDDLLGDAYEYLMKNFATESGKSKGQFYTPAEVSRIMAKVIGLGPHTTPQETIYDMACGSGSLLLKAADEALGNITIYGQEMDVATWSLAKMNMILHGHPDAELWRDNTLANPHFRADTRAAHGGTSNAATGAPALRTFDYAVANPPFSTKSWTSGVDPVNDPFNRFVYGVPPAKNGDYAFLLHMLASLKSTGTGAIILPHGVLFRGNKEAEIRRNLVKRGFIKGIIGLPANLFFGTGIPAAIIVLDKRDAVSRETIFMVDASKGFIKEGPKNRLRSQDIHRIVDTFTNAREIPRFSRAVPIAEIADPANDYNLNIPRYIDSSEPEDLHDLTGHLAGGIPTADVDALKRYWEIMPGLRAALFASGPRPGYVNAVVAPREVTPTITAHPEFAAFADRIRTATDAWTVAHRPALTAIAVNDRPRELIAALSEDLLTRLADLPLLDPYDAYQCLMDYWAETMQDDVYLIAADGWTVAARPRPIIEDKERKIKETADLTVAKKKFKMDLIPPSLIESRFFASQTAHLNELTAARDAAEAQLTEYVEEHTGDDGLLSDVVNDKGTLVKGDLKSRLKAISDDPEFEDEREALSRAQTLADRAAATGRTAKEARATLDRQVLERYGTLTEEEIKTLVVEDKWLTAIAAAIDREVQQIARRLADRVKDLTQRYAVTLPELEAEVETLSARVEGHLKQMGVEW